MPGDDSAAQAAIRTAEAYADAHSGGGGGASLSNYTSYAISGTSITAVYTAIPGFTLTDPVNIPAIDHITVNEPDEDTFTAVNQGNYALTLSVSSATPSLAIDPADAFMVYVGFSGNIPYLSLLLVFEGGPVSVIKFGKMITSTVFIEAGSTFQIYTKGSDSSPPIDIV